MAGKPILSSSSGSHWGIPRSRKAQQARKETEPNPFPLGVLRAFAGDLPLNRAETRRSRKAQQARKDPISPPSPLAGSAS
jgi:hypothetical protein